jgi:hypothetical protein
MGFNSVFKGLMGSIPLRVWGKYFKIYHCQNTIFFNAILDNITWATYFNPPMVSSSGQHKRI